ncbi:carbamoyltransferase HypF [Shimwellia blattae]|nr:carbamoyltransferase HypF [Shimwellia blattae]GAB80639.1 NiFe-hydrogenases maturation protein HypF [Shimwellia blattae DSM 4481 = NBRC 105725]VDY62726.1 Carbamoyltransferase hypF [Shimwellia blattae]VEC19516.1 Carbamoyltransferase hypF [Shimwellia blattae]
MRNQGVALRIRGKVQGVGFRPYIWQIASEMGLAGDVCNDGSGVVIRLVHLPEDFITALYQRCPPLARIDSLERSVMHWPALPDDFTIRQSDAGAMSTQIVPDAATCPACLAEMNDPAERRYRYPFINCTHCGPRFTIIRAMPYDRPFTVMAGFPLCAACEAEYRDPRDRRFHAQPVACPACGPWLSWQAGDQHAEREAALQAALAALRGGQIIAVKGVGGFHLVCDARNDTAVTLLRLRKQRPKKPLAVMLAQDSGLPGAACALLNTPAAPIVLVDKAHCGPLSPEIAPGLNEVGVLLPGNPLQHLLSQAFGGPLVMTSGNLSGRPPALTNPQALEDLAGLADGWLLHNRDILQRMDDSLVRADGSMLRRARGFVPDALPLPPGLTVTQPLLCLGADLKNTFALARGDQLVLSQHLGDLGQEGVEEQWQHALDLMRQVYDFTPQQVVMDAHPGYQLTRIGHQMGLPVHLVLHHHAHIAACLAEHHWPLDGGAVIGLALDGIGMGAEGELWGGECLRVDYRQCDKLGGLPAVALPGGDLAARQPWRNLLAHCLRFVPGWEALPETAVIRQQMWQPLAKAIARGVNAPLASSAGRLFDAAAAALGCVGLAQSYEGEAACTLEAMAWRHGPVDHPVSLPCVDGQLDLAVFWQSWLGWQAAPEARAWAFHDALAAGLAALARYHARQQGLNTVACGGGVWHNRLLSQRLGHHLADCTLLFPHILPAGDGAISAGQAVIAAAWSQAKG